VPVWAEKISVRQCGENLFIRGIPGTYSHPVPRLEALDDLNWHSDLPAIQEEMRRSISRDLLRPVFEQFQLKGTEMPAHLQFANAKETEELIEFTSSFGPVNATRVLERWGRLRAVQNLGVLIAEHEVFSALVGVVSALRTLEPLAHEITAKLLVLNRMPSGSPSERSRHLTAYEQLEKAASGQARFVLQTLIRLRDALEGASKSASRGFWDTPQLRRQLAAELSVVAVQCNPEIVLSTAHEAVQRSLNHFPPILVSAGELVVECPRLSPSGIRDALYFMLRLDYLQGRRLAFCANDTCGRVFAAQRMGAIWCSDRCSRKAINRKYWAEKGKLKRKARRNKKRE
jgi:hypothetical protein